MALRIENTYLYVYSYAVKYGVYGIAEQQRQRQQINKTQQQKRILKKTGDAISLLNDFYDSAFNDSPICAPSSSHSL